MLDVLFVHANASEKIYQGLSRDYSAIEPPIWAGLLANGVRSKGYNVEILDCEAERLTVEQSAQRIAEKEARLNVFVVFGQQPSASTQNMQGVRDLLEELDSNHDFMITLLVGLYPSADPRKTLMEEKCTYVAQGEGLYTILGLLEAADKMEDPLENTPGLWFNDFGKVKFTKPAPNIPQEKLHEELPGMAWDLLPMDKYRTSNWHAMSNNNDREPFAALYTSLGCPYQCSFCCINASFGLNNVENGLGKQKRFRFWYPHQK